MSLTLRLTLTYVLITLCGLLLLGGGGVWLFGVYTAQQRAQELEHQATIYAAYLGEVVIDTTTLEGLAPELAARAALPSGVTVRIFAPNGALLGGDSQLGAFPSRAALPLVRAAVPLPASQVAGRRYTARTIGDLTNPSGIVELSQSTEVEDALRQSLIQTLLPIALGAALVMALVSLLVARSIARPVSDLQRLAEELAAGGLQRRSPSQLRPPTRRDEIGRLAASLDHMATQLHQRIAEAEHERVKLAAVVGGISEGVIAITSDERVLFANPAAASVLAIDEQHHTRDEQILARLHDLDVPLLPTKVVDHERHIGQRVVLITVTPNAQHQTRADKYRVAPRSLIVLRDVTRLHALEQARSHAVRSISHELRTPLTALRGLIEHLQDDARPDQHGALATLEAETARLGRLVEELLRPSGAPAELRPIDVSQLARELIVLQQSRARRAGIALQSDIDDRVAVVRGDRDRLKQALLNLLDNALRATPPDGVVVVRVAPQDTGLRISVDDSGAGVPVELRERVWERGATGATLGLAETGGAGLGLALVREIVSGYGGRTSVEDSPLGGARFVIELS